MTVVADESLIGYLAKRTVLQNAKVDLDAKITIADQFALRALREYDADERYGGLRSRTVPCGVERSVGWWVDCVLDSGIQFMHNCSSHDSYSGSREEEFFLPIEWLQERYLKTESEAPVDPDEECSEGVVHGDLAEPPIFMWEGKPVEGLTIEEDEFGIRVAGHISITGAPAGAMTIHRADSREPVAYIDEASGRTVNIDPASETSGGGYPRREISWSGASAAPDKPVFEFPPISTDDFFGAVIPDYSVHDSDVYEVPAVPESTGPPPEWDAITPAERYELLRAAERLEGAKPPSKDWFDAPTDVGMKVSVSGTEYVRTLGGWVRTE